MTAADAEVIRFGDVGSTNDEAMARLRDGHRELWVTAERQLSGRGRRGRPWVSEAGNVYASYGFLPELPQDTMSILPLAAALALSDALAPHVETQLKWPNDVLIRGRKCAGILLESETGAQSGARRVVIGFGVNVAHHPDDAPATHLAQHAPDAVPDAVFDALRTALVAVLAALAEPDGAGQIRARWMQRGVGIGAPVTVRYERESIEGRFLGLDPSGRLILGQNGGATRLIAAGDVFVRAERL